MKATSGAGGIGKDVAFADPDPALSRALSG
jgi:hypothetical protein